MRSNLYSFYGVSLCNLLFIINRLNSWLWALWFDKIIFLVFRRHLHIFYVSIVLLIKNCIVGKNCVSLILRFLLKRIMVRFALTCFFQKVVSFLFLIFVFRKALRRFDFRVLSLNALRLLMAQSYFLSRLYSLPCNLFTFFLRRIIDRFN